MKFCPKCDEICSDKSNFCSNCGYSFGEIAPKEEQTALTKEEPEAAIAPVMAEEKQAPEAGISEEKEEKVPELTLTPEEKKKGAIQFVRVHDEEAVIDPGVIYIDDEYKGTIDYDSTATYAVDFGRHKVFVKAADQERTRELEVTEEEPVKIYKFSIRVPGAVKKKKKKKHTGAKIFCTILVVLAALAMFVPSNWIYNSLPESVQNVVFGASYEDIYNEYAAKLREATPKLIEEYNNEAAKNSRGVDGLAEIGAAKIEELAAISAEGTEKMASKVKGTNPTSSVEYMEWSTKLNALYMEESAKISSLYLSDSVDSFSDSMNDMMGSLGF